MDFGFGVPAGEVEAEHFEQTFGRFSFGPEADEQGGDDRHVNLDGDAGAAVAEDLAAAEDALEPAETEFDLPALVVRDGDKFDSPVQVVGG